MATEVKQHAAMLAVQVLDYIHSVRALVQLPLPLLEKSREIERPDNCQSFAVKGDFASWIRLNVNNIRCDGVDPKSPK